MINLLNEVKKVAHFAFLAVTSHLLYNNSLDNSTLKKQLSLSLFFDSYGKSSSQ